MMHVSEMDIEMFHRARRGESSKTSNAQARHEGDVIACVFAAYQVWHSDGGRLKDHLLDLWKVFT